MNKFVKFLGKAKGVITSKGGDVAQLAIAAATGDFKGALIDFDQTIELKNETPSVYFNRGNTKRELNDLEGASISRYSIPFVNVVQLE